MKDPVRKVHPFSTIKIKKNHRSKRLSTVFLFFYSALSRKMRSILNGALASVRKYCRSNEENIGMSVIIESLNRAKLDKKEFLLLKAIAFVHSGEPENCMPRN